jgi:2-iminoacetate synthase ThiH
MKSENELKQGEDFYFDSGFIVFTEKYHLNRGYCCGNGCRHCPFDYENVPEAKRTLLLKTRNNIEK